MGLHVGLSKSDVSLIPHTEPGTLINISGNNERMRCISIGLCWSLGYAGRPSTAVLH